MVEMAIVATTPKVSKPEIHLMNRLYSVLAIFQADRYVCKKIRNLQLYGCYLEHCIAVPKFTPI